MSTENGAGAAAGTVAQTAGDSGKGKTYSEEEVQALLQQRLQGQGKVIKEYQEKEAKQKESAEAEERKKLEEQGKAKELLQLLESERSARATLEKRETDRLAKVVASNDLRIKALPENLQALVPPGLDADSTADQIGRLEALAKVQTVRVHGAAGSVAGPLTDEERKKAHAAALAAKGLAFVFGSKKEQQS